MLQKQAIDISFAQGLDTKTDPKRIAMGKFRRLKNKVFNKDGLLEKRTGYSALSSLNDNSYSTLTTFNNNLTAIGQTIAAYNAGGNGWVYRGSIQPVSIDTLPLIRNNFNQTACDSAVAPNGLVCTVYLESNGSTTTNKYVVSDSVTGQNIVAPAPIPVASGVPTGGMRVFVLGTNFIMVFTNVISGTSHLQYVAVNIVNPTLYSANTDIASSYVSASNLSWDGFVVNNRLFFAYNTTTGGQSIKVTYLASNLVLASAVTFSGYKATMMSVCADLINPASPIICVSFAETTTPAAYSLAVDQNLNTILAPTAVVARSDLINVTSSAYDGFLLFLYEVYTPMIGPNHYLIKKIINISTGSVGSATAVCYGGGLGSKSFLVNGTVYVLLAHDSAYQPTYFLLDVLNSDVSSTPQNLVIAGKLAYQNGGGYLTTGIPGVSITGNVAQIPYRFKSLIQAVNKSTNPPSGTQTAGIYSQTGINLATFEFNTSRLDTAEIGNDLHLSGGFLGMYDGYLPVEHNFFLWPEDVSVSINSTTGGSLSAQDYYYVLTYEWTDNQGNAFRSAPSIPVKVTVAVSGSVVAVACPALPLTMKIANPVKIVIYRWSTAQQNYYQVTSISSPVINILTSPGIAATYLDTSSDATILGNNLLYTTGGVIEDINAPGSNTLTLFDTRLWLVDAEDKNLLWFSKQVIEGTPVEMSDLFTVYVPPTVGTETNTGVVKTLSVMDDKLIIGKDNAFVYINGSGPDNTGANNQYSQPIFITSTVGCNNQKSIILTPKGLMFESDKGIWLLDRGLGTSYIGAPVEEFTTGATVLSAVTVPETNQVRFLMSSGITLMYDYYFDQWGVFEGVPGISSCIYGGAHTYLNQYGQVFRQSTNSYLDGDLPVLLGFTTGPIRLGDLQNYQRAYFFYLLGEYLSPHKLYVTVSFDYENNPSQSFTITPDNYSTPYGSGSSQSPFGEGNPYGGPSKLELWRVFLQNQRCMAFSISVDEVYDPSFGVVAGAGLTLSGLNVVCGFKKGFRPQPASSSIG